MGDVVGLRNHFADLREQFPDRCRPGLMALA
jgi:hypothetical protein